MTVHNCSVIVFLRVGTCILSWLVKFDSIQNYKIFAYMVLNCFWFQYCSFSEIFRILPCSILRLFNTKDGFLVFLHSRWVQVYFSVIWLLLTFYFSIVYINLCCWSCIVSYHHHFCFVTINNIFNFSFHLSTRQLCPYSSIIS